jgi:Holliday junction DNA helicase RuvA
MIASLDGVVGAVAADSLVLEVGGVGYRIFVAPAVLAAVEPGRRLRLHTHHLVREDLQALYGFRTPEELGFFGLLLTVTGVGPKVALGLLGSRPVADLQLAIMADDQGLLTAVPGVGRRLAATTPGGVGAGTLLAEGDVVGALQALGYTLAEAREAARHARAGGAGTGSLEDRVKAALRSLSGG